MSRYKNTITVGRGKSAIFSPPSGAKADAWDALRTLRPELDGARIADGGSCVHVQVERTMGTVAHRTAVIDSLAEAFRSPLETHETSWDAGTGTVWWTVISHAGEQFCVETTDCSCHPDGSAS
jgi:hypothetical protein